MVAVRGLFEAFRPDRRSRRFWGGSERWALSDVSFDVAAGEMLGVVGRNGSGKSSLLQVIAGVYRPSRGEVSTTGRVSSLIDLGAGLHRDLTGAENLVTGGVLLGLSRSEVRSRYARMVEFSELDAAVLAAPICTYSAGMVLRLAFSLVVCSEPSTVLIDEVLAVGDEGFQNKCLAWVGRLLEAGGTAVVASHDLDLVAKHCHRVAVLDRGRLVALGDPADGIALYHELGAGEP